MLFSAIVSVHRTLSRHSITILALLLLKFAIVYSAQLQVRPQRALNNTENVVNFSGNFQHFLNELGSMVYKSKKYANNHRHTHLFTTKSNYKNHRKNAQVQSRDNLEKEAVGDVLMMKLVSYYEDKYNVAPHETTIVVPTTRHMTPATRKIGRYDSFFEDRYEGLRQLKNYDDYLPGHTRWK